MIVEILMMVTNLNLWKPFQQLLSVQRTSKETAAGDKPYCAGKKPVRTQSHIKTKLDLDSMKTILRNRMRRSGKGWPRKMIKGTVLRTVTRHGKTTYLRTW
jgi:hypothetical protein